MTELATPELDEALAEDAPGRTATELRRAALRARRVTADESEDAHERRSLSLRWDLGDRALRVTGLLPEDAGAAVEAALTRIVETRARETPSLDEANGPGDGPPPDDGPHLPPLEAQYADALVELARTRLAADPDPDRATVVLHVDASALSGDRGVREIAGGPALSPETAMRLACDARLQVVVDGPDGRPVGVGQTTRTVPPWLLRLLRERDEECRWPGCHRRRLLHTHHLLHSADGGPTDMDNLCMLCIEHHRFVHEKGWRIEGDPSGELRFVGPDGRVLTSKRPGLRPEIRDRLLGGDREQPEEDPDPVMTLDDPVAVPDHRRPVAWSRAPP